MYRSNTATTFAQKKNRCNGLITYIDYLEIINRPEGQRSILGVHRVDSSEEKGNCQDLGLNISSRSYFTAICGKRAMVIIDFRHECLIYIFYKKDPLTYSELHEHHKRNEDVVYM